MTRRHELLRVLNKRFLNPLILRFAGTRFFPFAVVQHVGRRSGKHFETPIIARPAKGGFVIALTYGSDVDWYRNLQAAGGGVLRWHSKEYPVAAPQPLDPARAYPAFPLPLRIFLRLNRTEEFLQAKFNTGSTA